MRKRLYSVQTVDKTVPVYVLWEFLYHKWLDEQHLSLSLEEWNELWIAHQGKCRQCQWPLQMGGDGPQEQDQKFNEWKQQTCRDLLPLAWHAQEKQVVHHVCHPQTLKEQTEAAATTTNIWSALWEHGTCLPEHVEWWSEFLKARAAQERGSPQRGSLQKHKRENSHTEQTSTKNKRTRR